MEPVMFYKLRLIWAGKGDVYAPETGEQKLGVRSGYAKRQQWLGEEKYSLVSLKGRVKTPLGHLV